MQGEISGRRDNRELDPLHEEHRRYAEKVEGLAQVPYLSAEDRMEEIRLKKLKLKIKDQMAGNLPAYHFS